MSNSRVCAHSQLTRLRALSCDFARGYLFSVPVNAANVTRLLSEDYRHPLTGRGPEAATRQPRPHRLSVGSTSVRALRALCVEFRVVQADART